MNEKDYGGDTKYSGKEKKGKGSKNTSKSAGIGKEKKVKKEISFDTGEEFDRDKLLKAGKISVEIKEYIKTIVKKDVPLVEIAERIEGKIEELGGKNAFPVNLSIDDVAAHYTPLPDDESVARGLLKVDFGVHIDGWVADTAVSFDLENSDENKKLIKAAEEALANAIKVVREGVNLGEIGKAIQSTIESYGATPIINLSGHSVSHYDLHSGVTIPNYDNNTGEILEEGVCAIEPFATFGNGKVYDGKPSGIYQLISDRNLRSPIARKILDFIIEEYSTLPFCSRWIVKKFGNMALFGLKQLVDNGNLHNFEELIEVSHKPVAQAEHTMIVKKDSVEITTK